MIGIFCLFGLAIGSFLNVCADRLPNMKSILGPPSHCEVCGHKLAPLDLIPLLSYLFLRGRCRYCQATIPRRVPLVELGTGLLFLLLWHHYGLSLQLAQAVVFTCVFIIVSVTDLEHRLIPNLVIYPAMVIALLFALLDSDPGIISALSGGAIAMGFPLLLLLLIPGSIGMGDVKLCALVGLIVGFPLVFVALFISFVLAGTVSAALLVLGMKKRGEFVPLAPFLATGGIATMLYGEQILRLYLGT
jgi:leader peptidase (prepilin peptidase)/N-methyltransferase